MDYLDKAKELFMNTNTTFPPRIIWAMGLVKYASAMVNLELGLLNRDVALAIAKASRDLMSNPLSHGINVDVFQTGSGTGLNMAINVAIAKAASGELGSPVHPIDHVNLCQSSNDAVPTAIRVASVAEYQWGLRNTLTGLIKALEAKAKEYSGVIKSGRTHLRDALPVTLGQELGAYADALSHDAKLIEVALEHVAELPMGGTAVGTGVNAHPEFGGKVIEFMGKVTGLPLKGANPFRAMRLLTDLLALSGALRALAVDMFRLSQDIRLMFSGPFTGLGEIELPMQANLLGSSIMAGKANPVTVEATMLISAQVMGLDHANQVASMLGEFELSMGIPLVGYNVIKQVELLGESIGKFSRVVVGDMVPKVGRMREVARSSQALATLLVPLVGYEEAARVSEELARGLSIEEALGMLGLAREDVERALNLEELTKPGFPMGRGGSGQHKGLRPHPRANLGDEGSMSK